MLLLVDLLIKATVLLLAVFGLGAILRRSSAATRHLVWCFGLVGLLLMPILSAVVPWSLPVLPMAEPVPIGEPYQAPASGRGSPVGVEPVRSAEGIRFSQPFERTAASPSVPEIAPAADSRSSRTAPDVDPVAALVGVWLLGAALIVGRLGFGLMMLGRHARRARPASGAQWEAAREWATSRLLLDTPVRLLISDELPMPLAAGIFRPLVLMPAEAEGWAEARRRAVLLHEMAHVKRRDVLPHLMAWLACALWWFHPLAWAAARRMRSESEKACDDLVLRVGTRASRYADDLLEIVTRAGSARMPAAVVPLAQRSEFEGRILAILEPDRSRQSSSVVQAAAVAVAVALFAVPLAAVGPRSPAPPLAAGSPGEEPEEERGLVPDVIEDLVSKDADSKADADAAESKEAIDAGLPGAEIAGELSIDGDLTESEVVFLEEGLSFDVQVEEAKRPAPQANGRAVAALIGRLRDEDHRVRLAAAQSLGELADPRAVEALSRALRQDADPKVRAMAAWALGQIEDPAAVAVLSDALRGDEDGTVRLRAAEALGQIEDSRAVDALLAGLQDSSVEVRRASVWALGGIEDPRAVSLLLPLLDDRDVEIRRGVTDALGSIESPQAVDALMGAVDDNDLEVRVSAINALGNIEDPRALPVLTDALDDPVAEIRRQAVDAIGSLNLGTAPPEVIDAVRDPDREVRHGAIDALDNFEDPAAVPALLEIVRTSMDRELQYSALEALSGIPSQEAYDALIPLLEHEDPKVRLLAAEAIGDMQ